MGGLTYGVIILKKVKKSLDLYGISLVYSYMTKGEKTMNLVSQSLSDLSDTIMGEIVGKGVNLYEIFNPIYFRNVLTYIAF